MESLQPASKSNSLFQVYLRLRPPQAGAAAADRFLNVEPPAADAPSQAPTHIQLNPPNDRRRAIEKFCFTQVFEEDASQLDVFQCTNIVPLVEGVLAPHGGEGTDALLATLGVTGSGKSHTILGSRSQRGLTQLTLDVLYRSIGQNMVDCSPSTSLEASIAASDASEAKVYTASTFLDSVYADAPRPSSYSSRAPTPMLGEYPAAGATPQATSRRLLNKPTGFPQQPDISGVHVSSDNGSQYTVLVSMYEVYNDRIFDLLTPPIKSATTKEYRRRPLLFKSTELSPDRKTVAGLRKIICSNVNEALLVLEAGLHERRVAGTGSNSVSSRSHGFVCIEVKKRTAHSAASWSGNVLTIVDLAGSERARDAKTAGATLAEAGKINESLMYLGQCLQMQSDVGSSNKPNMVPFRQCKLTELLFSNSFPSTSMLQSSQFGQSARRNAQKAVMIVTADPHGDFNATSQILRYSALAREITVPRIPSVTQTILGSAQADSQQTLPSLPTYLPAVSSATSARQIDDRTVHTQRPVLASEKSVFTKEPETRSFSTYEKSLSDDRATVEIAVDEIARMSEEIEYLRASLEAETEKCREAESHLVSMADRMMDQEQDIREECAIEFEQRLAVEMSRWKASLELEKERGVEHWDRKVEVMERLQNREGENSWVGIDRCDHEDKENVLVENLEEENGRLRHEIAVLKRELAGRSPVKRRPLRERDDLPMASPGTKTTTSAGHSATGKLSDNTGDSILRKMERLRMSDDDADTIMGRPSTRPSGASTRSIASNTSPKKIRKLSPRKWDVALDDDDLF
ncbi:hypothetical protein SEPCBS119000_002155 [Sporothrix epigloea]|uniref:Kinesin motor domain-containing protein n=1 Tax=Sporothrix epigloea TaxID=1892477 RepID=A0ABP0DEL0_9PEZI